MLDYVRVINFLLLLLVIIIHILFCHCLVNVILLTTFFHHD